MNFFSKLKALLPAREVKKIYLILVGVFVMALLETLGVGVILPFVRYVSDPTILNDYPQLTAFLAQIGLESERQTILVLALSILIFMVAKNLYIYFFLRVQLTFQYANSAQYSVDLLEKYLFADYLFHLRTNSSLLLRNLKQEVPLLFTRAVGPLIVLVSELATSILVFGLLLWVKPVATLAGFVTLGALGLLFYRPMRHKARFYGKKRLIHEEQTFRWINQSLGGIKETKLYHAEGFFVEKTRDHYQQLAQVTIFEVLMGQTPRLFLEALMGVALMGIIIFLVLQGQDSTQIFPTLALFAAAAFRLMPATNRILGSLLTLKIAAPSLEVVYENFMEMKALSKRQPDPQAPKGPRFEGDITLKGLSFSYPGASQPALAEANLTIRRFASIGILGPSGSGKSTLLNLLLGLLNPTQGEIWVGGRSIHEDLTRWQSEIGYVPQDIYLIDDKIKNNIAFGVQEDLIDPQKLAQALEMAQLKELVESLPEGLETQVGERGVRLSGGQRQRIGIARALYHDPEVLIFDEATSALDPQTELEITKSIESLTHKKTIIIVAHRLTTLEHCDLVYRLDQGSIEATQLS